MLKSFGLAYRGYMEWKFERLFLKAKAHGMTEDELCNSDHRFSLYMRVGRAFEACSEKKVIDFISDVMVGGIRSGEADENSDLVQMALSSVSNLTETELNLLLLMREHRKNDLSSRDGYQNYLQDVERHLFLTRTETTGILYGLLRTGLVLPPDTGPWAESTIYGFRLTSLADTLFSYVSLCKRHHQ
ncbi:hypothetical protein [Chromohalobacter israelensis]|nr:hypothetical protein [Chromohalobacter israelensis]MDF9433018.1 hypothetical protein [Chromohalobacter israelensis]